jgi:hypothetical protein
MCFGRAILGSVTAAQDMTARACCLTRGEVMPVTIAPDSVGPVDVAVIGFVGDNFHGEIVPALQALVDSDVVRIIDLAFVAKTADGETAALEVLDSDVAEAFQGFDDDQHDLLNDEDLMTIAESLEPATAALVIVWENRWAAGFAQAVRNANGFLVSLDRIPHETVVRAIEALEGE